jgi:flagellar motor switch protein FliM
MDTNVFFLEIKTLQDHMQMVEKLQKSVSEHAKEALSSYIGKNVEVCYIHTDGFCRFIKGKFIKILKRSPCLSIEREDGVYYTPRIYDLISIKEIQ